MILITYLKPVHIICTIKKGKPNKDKFTIVFSVPGTYSVIIYN